MFAALQAWPPTRAGCAVFACGVNAVEHKNCGAREKIIDTNADFGVPSTSCELCAATAGYGGQKQVPGVWRR